MNSPSHFRAVVVFSNPGRLIVIDWFFLNTKIPEGLKPPQSRRAPSAPLPVMTSLFIYKFRVTYCQALDLVFVFQISDQQYLECRTQVMDIAAIKVSLKQLLWVGLVQSILITAINSSAIGLFTTLNPQDTCNYLFQTLT